MKTAIKFEVLADKSGNGDWRVEGIGPDGECYVAIFCGPDAEDRAKFYAKNVEILA